MKLKLWAASGALLAAMPGVQAQQSSRTPDPSDPSAPVPPIVYESALGAYRPAPQDLPSPDKSWRAANQAVAGQPGHGAHHTPAPEPGKGEATRPATPPAAPQEHDKHH